METPLCFLFSPARPLHLSRPLYKSAPFFTKQSQFQNGQYKHKYSNNKGLCQRTTNNDQRMLFKTNPIKANFKRRNTLLCLPEERLPRPSGPRNDNFKQILVGNFGLGYEGAGVCSTYGGAGESAKACFAIPPLGSGRILRLGATARIRLRRNLWLRPPGRVCRPA